MSLFHVPNINVTVSTTAQDVVNALEKKLKPSEMVVLLSWLTEVLDWSDRKRLIMQLSKDWSNDLADELKEIGDEDPEEKAELAEYLKEVSNALKESAEIIQLTVRQMNKARAALEQEGEGGNAASTTVFEKREDSRRS